LFGETVTAERYQYVNMNLVSLLEVDEQDYLQVLVAISGGYSRYSKFSVANDA